MDYEKIVHTLIDDIVEDPKSILIRVSEGTTPKDVLIIIAAEKEDMEARKKMMREYKISRDDLDN